MEQKRLKFKKVKELLLLDMFRHLVVEICTFSTFTRGAGGRLMEEGAPY